MRDFLKKVLAIVLALGFCFTSIPAGQIAAEPLEMTEIPVDQTIPTEIISEETAIEPEVAYDDSQEVMDDGSGYYDEATDPQAAADDGSGYDAATEEYYDTSASVEDTSVDVTEAYQAPSTEPDVYTETPEYAFPSETQSMTEIIPATEISLIEIPNEEDATTQEVTTPEETTPANKTSFIYEDPEIYVEATLDEEDALPENAVFVVKQIFEDSLLDTDRNLFLWSNELLDKYLDKIDLAQVNTFVYDMYFELDGQRLMPAKEFKIKLTYKEDKILDEEAKRENVRIFHLDDNDYTAEIEAFDTNAELWVNEKGSVTTAEFKIPRYRYTPLMISMIETKEEHEARLAEEASREAEENATAEDEKNLIVMDDPDQESESDAEETERKLITTEDENESDATEEETDEEETTPERRYYTSWGNDVDITVILSDPAQVPDTAEVVVTPVTPEAEDYNYDAYIEALNSSDESITYTPENTLLYDIKFVDTVRDENGEIAEEIEYEPTEGTVKVILQFNNNQLSNEINAKKSQNVTVNHLMTDAETDTTDISAGDISVVEVEAAVQLKGTDKVAFNTDSFSVYAFSYTVDFEYSVSGKLYQFSIPGGGFVSFSQLVELLGLIDDTDSEENEDEIEIDIAEDITEIDVIEEMAEVNEIDEAEEVEAVEEVAETEIDTTAETDESAVADGEGADDIEAPLTLDEVEVSDSIRDFLADVESVVFSSPDLVDVSKVDVDTTVGQIKENRGLECQYSAELTEDQIEEINEQTVEAGDWALISLQPFTSEETLTVIMKDGEVFTIRVTDAQIKKTVIDAKGDTWEITVTYGEDAQIPDGAELVVKEILTEDEEYSDLYEEAVKKASDDAKQQGIVIPVVSGARLFDIEIHDEEGKIQPKAPVQVDIRLAGEKADFESVVHFAENGVEVMELQNIPVKSESSENTDDAGDASEKGSEDLSKEIRFETESFSVYTVVDVNNSNLVTDGPFILVTGIQGDPGADVGYQEDWGTDYFTKVVNGMAMTNESREHGLSSIGVHVWDEGSQGFVGGEATQWTFEQGTNGNYYIKDNSGQYLRWSSYTTTNWAGGTDTHYDGISLTNDKNDATQFTVTPTGDTDGSVYLSFMYQDTAWYLHNNQYSGTNEWSSRNYMVKQNPTSAERNSSAYKFKLCKQSNDYISFAAAKVSSTQVTTNKNYVIYHKFEDADGNEELYALASDGTFVRVYDGGDRIYWRKTEKNIYWNYQSGDGHHLMSIDPSTNTSVYLNPIASGEGQTISTEDHYLTLDGKDNDEYGTTIEQWDQVAYDYAGLHVVKNGNTIQLEPGTRNAGTSDEFLFAVASSMPGDNKEPVATVDSAAYGIKITMFDYGDPENPYSAGYKLPEMTAIAGSDAYTPHAAHSLVKPYLVGGLPANYSGYPMTGLFDSGGAITAKIEGVNHLFLQSYYDENGTFRYRSEDNYAYIPLDDSTKNFTVYSQVATPYTTDRQVGHAYYYHGHFMPFNDIDMNNHLSRLLDQYGMQEIPLEDGRTYEDVYGITGIPNYYTGMKMEASFIQPSDGVLENGNDMVFKFTGDDDMWVYIDGVLVLDIGGIHEPLSGTINFHTGEVTNPVGSSLAGTRTLYDIFMAVYNDPNTPQEVKEKISTIEWNGGTFADFTTHSFGAFYMERGAGASNLDLQFNLKIAKTDEFVVRKEMPEGVDDRFVNHRFKYQVTYKDVTEPDVSKQVKPLYKGAKNNKNEEVCLAVTYKDHRDPVTGQPITVEVPVDNNGYFYLFPGEAAVFKVASETVEYDVKEVTIDPTQIKQVDINNKKNVDIIEDLSVTDNGKIADAEFAKVIDRGEVVYTNHPQTQNLLITKHLSDDSAPLIEGEMPVFEFRVYLESPVKDNQGNVTVDQQGKPVTKLIPYSYGPYYLMKDGEYYTLTGENNAPVRQGTTPVICSSTGRSGSINSIPLEYTIVIPDIAVGTHFYLEERRDNIPNGFEFVKEELTPETYDQETLYTGNPDAEVINRIIARDEDDVQAFDPSTIGRIKNGKDAESHVYNRKPAIDIPVQKQWVPANNTPDSVSLALVRFMAPDENQHTIIEGKGAILIHHYADYGNGNEALPGGFRATYTIKNKTTGDIVFTGTGNRTYDVDPGEYTVITNVTNWGNVPSNFTCNESQSTHTTDVTVVADQSSTVILTSKYDYVADGTITISHTASYTGGTLKDSTELPEGFRATYSIKDNATGQYIYTNVAVGTYDVAPGTYTVTARISSIAAPQDYYYQNTTTNDSVEVTSRSTTSVTFTSSYEYREAPPVDGHIKFSHVSSGLPDTTNLPEGFQANVVIEGPAKTIDNAAAGVSYDVPPGDYQIYVKQIYSNGNLPEGYFYTKTDPIPVTVTSAQNAFDNTLTSTFGQCGYLTIKHQSQGISGTSPNMPNSFSAGYTIKNKETGEAIKEHATINTEYAVQPGEYIVEMAEIYYEGEHQNYNCVNTDTATVTVSSGERKTATLTSTYERVGGNNTDVYLCVAYSPSPNDNSTCISVPINSEVNLKYHGFYNEAWHQQTDPNWELYYYNGSSWQKVNGIGGGVPTDQGDDIRVGEEIKYCVLINTDPSFEQYLGASLTPKTSSAQGTENAPAQMFAFSNPASNDGTATQMKTASSETNSNTGFRFQRPANMKSLSSPVSTSKPLLGAATSTVVRDMTTAEVLDLTIPETFDIPSTYTLDRDFGKMLTLTDPWKYTFKDLPEYDKNGNEYYYAIIEVEVPKDYKVSYSPQQPVKASDIRANMLARAEAEDNHQTLPDLLTLTATNTTTIVEGDLQVTKTVKLNGVNDSIHGGTDLTFYVGLFESETAETAMTGTVKPIIVQNGSAVGNVVYHNLTVGNMYFVFETDAQGHKLAVNQKRNGYIVTANGGQSDPISVKPTVNIDIVNEKRTGDLELTKIVTGTGADKTKQFEFTIELTPPAGETLAASYSATHSGDNTVTTATITGDKVTGIKLKHNETYTIKDLPEGTTYKITENDYSQLGYTSFISNSEGTIIRGTAGKVGVTAKNTYEATQVTIKKVDVANLEKEDLTTNDLLKGAAFKITKYENKNFEGIVTTWETNGTKELADVKNGDSYTLNGSFTFTNLSKGFYVLEETVFPNGYVHLESNIRFEIGDDMKVYLLDESGNRISENKTGILKVLPITGTQTENVMIFGNTPGPALPNTGGPGTRLFTILGSILILGAGILLWRRRRLI